MSKKQLAKINLDLDILLDYLENIIQEKCDICPCNNCTCRCSRDYYVGCREVIKTDFLEYVKNQRKINSRS